MRGICESNDGFGERSIDLQETLCRSIDAKGRLNEYVFLDPSRDRVKNQ